MKYLLLGIETIIMNLNRKHFLKSIAATVGVITLMPHTLILANENKSLFELIFKIGNTNGEKQRAKILEDALKELEFTSEEKEILEKLFFIADRWANGFEKYPNPGSEGNESKGYLCGFFLFKCTIDRFLLPQLEESDKFFPLVSYYRSKILIAQLIQNGKISGNPVISKEYIAESKRLMEFAVIAFPKNILAKNYLGDYEFWDELYEPIFKAPDWANAQRMVLEKLSWLIHWWVDNRQISDGQFGGGWGDDVEMWRKWMPILFAFEDEKAYRSQEKLFEGLYGLSRMKNGYTEYLNDVEHTSEEYSDPLFCMLNLQPENPIWEKRALKVLDTIENLWTGINDRGQLQFKSSWFSVDKIDLDEKRACDTPYHTRLMQPLMLIWLRTGDKRIGQFVTRWLKTWVDATFTAECGKPMGIVPAAIHWPDGKPAGMGENWWHPENYHAKLYDYPSKQSTMYEYFLQAYFISKDEYYLKPVLFLFENQKLVIDTGKEKEYSKGSLEWSLSKMGKSIPDILVKYKLVTGDNSYDGLLEKSAGGYERFLIDNNFEKLGESMVSLKKSLSLPREFYTSEVRWTDRLFAFNKYFNMILKEPIPNFNANFLFSTLTGSIGNVKVLPAYGAKWLTPPTEIAILTMTNSTQKFEAQLFHFGNKPREMGVKFFNLENGNYKIEFTGEQTSRIKLEENNRKIEITLPSQTLVNIKLEKLS